MISNPPEYNSVFPKHENNENAGGSNKLSLHHLKEGGIITTLVNSSDSLSVISSHQRSQPHSKTTLVYSCIKVSHFL